MKAGKEFNITDADKQWVEDQFRWMINALGYPQKNQELFLFTSAFFPNTVHSSTLNHRALLQDIIQLFHFAEGKVSCEVETDLRDTPDMPLLSYGGFFETSIEFIETANGYSYKIYLPNALLKNPKRLILEFILQCVRIELCEGHSSWISNDHHYHTLFLIGIYRGWSAILCNTTMLSGSEYINGWQQKIYYKAPIPQTVIAYSMAIFKNLCSGDDGGISAFLTSEMNILYKQACSYFETNSFSFSKDSQITFGRLIKEADFFAKKRNFTAAIGELQKSLFLDITDENRGLALNNIGYYNLWLNEYKKSCKYFLDAIKLHPSFGFAYDNLAFASIQLKNLDDAEHYLLSAMETGNNDPGYSSRNWALFYWAKGDHKKAEQYFLNAFENIKIPIDWLEYYYALFLFEQGNKESANLYLQLAVEKNEPAAINLMNELSTNEENF